MHQLFFFHSNEHITLAEPQKMGLKRQRRFIPLSVSQYYFRLIRALLTFDTLTPHNSPVPSVPASFLWGHIQAVPTCAAVSVSAILFELPGSPLGSHQQGPGALMIRPAPGSTGDA